MQKQKIDRPWDQYPIGTKANACNGGHWEKTKLGWKWCTGDTFGTPGGDATSVTLPEKEHTEYKCKTRCQEPGCMFCDGGLFACTVCGLIEGCLTTHCPGYNCYKDMNEDIYNGKIDFRNGAWVNKCSPHSPEYYRTEEYQERYGGHKK